MYFFFNFIFFFISCHTFSPNKTIWTHTMSEWWPPNKYAPTAEEDIKAARNCIYGTQILSLFPFLTSCLLDVRKRNESEHIYQMMHFCSGNCYFNDVLKCINSIIKLPSTQKCLYTKRSFSEILLHMSITYFFMWESIHTWILFN